MSTQIVKSFPAMLTAYQAEIARALPKHMNGDRLARVALTCFRQTPALGRCEPKSVFAAVVMSAQLGLEPGIGGQAYLVPYGTECQFVPGWQGLVDLVSRAGRASVWTGAVFEGDEFDYALGDSPFIKHKPSGDEDEALLTHVYAVGRIENAKWPVIEVWPIDKVIRHRDRYNKVGKKHYSYKHLEMYARKVALLQVLKYMPKSVELQQAIALEYAAEHGSQHLNTEDAINGTWAPVPEDDEQENKETSQEIVQPKAKAPDPHEEEMAAHYKGRQPAQYPPKAPAPVINHEPQQAQPEPEPQAAGFKDLSDVQVGIVRDLQAAANISDAALFAKFPEVSLLNFKAVRAWLRDQAQGGAK